MIISEQIIYSYCCTTLTLTRTRKHKKAVSIVLKVQQYAGTAYYYQVFIINSVVDHSKEDHILLVIVIKGKMS